jgi:hypothetical protein
MKGAFLWTAALALALATGGQTGSSKHSITLTFDYDFRTMPVCSSGVIKNCVAQFNVYDISAGVTKRTKLFSSPPPPGATGVVKGIRLTTPTLLFESGKHMLAVTAQTPAGTESDPKQCITWVEIQ